MEGQKMSYGTSKVVAVVVALVAMCIVGDVTAAEVRINLEGASTAAAIGVPFKQGELADAAGVQLAESNGKKVACSSKVASTWPDGSIRGLVLELPEKGGPGPLTLEYTPRAERQERSETPKVGPVRVTRPGAEGVAEDLGNKIIVRTGPLKVLVSASNWKAIGQKELPASYNERFALNPTPGGKHPNKNRPDAPIYPRPCGMLNQVWMDVNGDGDFADSEQLLSGEALPGLVLRDAEDNYYLSHLSRHKKVRIVENSSTGCKLEVSGAMTRLYPTGHAQRDFKKLGYQYWLTTSYEEPEEAWFVWTAILGFQKGSPKITCDLTVERGGHTWRYAEFGRRELSRLVPVRSLTVELKPRDGTLLVTQTAGKVLNPTAVEVSTEGVTTAFLWKADKDKPLAVGEGFALSSSMTFEFKGGK
jgi:hypothetical protein